MSRAKKGLLAFLFLVVAMAVVACSNSSIIPLGTTPTSSSQEAIPGLAGTWQDPDTGDQVMITWQGNTYVVASVTWQGDTYSISSQAWNGKSLSWTYDDTDLGLTVTYTTTSLSGSDLNAVWSYSDGTSGPVTLTRVTS